MNVLDVRVIRVANLAVVFAFLTACGSQQVKPSEQPVAATAQISKPVASAAKAKSAKERVIDELLASAQQAFRDDKLTTPSHDNSYDQFQSVLALDPENSSARAGVQAILISYAEWARNAIASGDYAGAQGYLNQAQLYFPANPLLMELQQTIAKAKQQRKQQEQVVLAQEPPAERTEFSLPGLALSKKSPAVASYLARIAARVKESGESVMIYARSDAEGRWIYQQMNNATQGYRVRGDIRVASAPKIVLLPPL